MNHHHNKNMISNVNIIFIIALSILVLTTRRHELFSHPQLWAEDGRAFLQPIWNGSVFSSLLTPQDGYFQTLPKLTMAFAAMFGISKVATISLYVATVIRLAFIAFILSNRFSYINKWMRIAFTLYFSLQPNVQEVYINITNTHTYLAIYLLAVLISSDSTSATWKAHDFIILILSGLSGPFIVLLAPSLALKRVYQHGGIFKAMKHLSLFDVLFAAIFFIQFISLTIGGSPRPNSDLGASIPLFINLISYKIILGSFVDLGHLQWLMHKTYLNSIVLAVTFASFLYITYKSSWQFKVVSLYVIITIFVALYKPIITPSGEQWPLFFIPIVGCRYFIVSGLAIFCLYAYTVKELTSLHRTLPYILSAPVILLLGVSYSIPRLNNVGFEDDINKYKNSKEGESVTLHTNPPGWYINLIKK